MNVLGVVLLVFSSAAKSMVVYDPANYIQNFKTAYQMVKQLEQSAKQTKHQFEQLKSLKTNIDNFQWKNLNQAIHDLSRDVEQGKSLAFSMSNLDKEFKRRFPGFEKSGSNKTNYQEKYKEWVNTNQNTMHGMMKALNTQYDSLKKEQSLKDSLMNQAKTANGSMKAIQVGNEIAAEQVNQMQHLRQIMLTNTNAITEYQAFQAQKEAAKEQAIDDVLAHTGDDLSAKYDGSGGFGQFK